MRPAGSAKTPLPSPPFRRCFSRRFRRSFFLRPRHAAANQRAASRGGADRRAEVLRRGDQRAERVCTRTPEGSHPYTRTLTP
eukprot:2057918-Pyramimonas_sp.AAC.1